MITTVIILFILLWSFFGFIWFAGTKIWQDKAFYPYGLILRILAGPIFWMLDLLYHGVTISDRMSMSFEDRQMEKELINHVKAIKPSRRKTRKKTSKL